MKPLIAREIFGNWASLLLPINADDSIDYGLLGAELDHFVAAKVNGVYSNGSAGEFYTQTEEEFDRVSQLLAEKCERAGLPFQIGACHVSPQLSRERVRRAKALRPGAFQIVLPDWFPPSWPEVVEECAANPLAGLQSEERIRGFWQANVAPLITKHDLPNMAADKAAAVAGGWLSELSPRLRWPYRSATSEMIAQIAQAARVAVPEFFFTS